MLVLGRVTFSKFQVSKDFLLKHLSSPFFLKGWSALLSLGMAKNMKKHSHKVV